ncbi:peptidyl-tRNA hydrolase [Thermanaerovibrio velox DSM 12556]|uniref:Peptidyl-tRNA hydrolase n=1 Tax=Thermanaerovibrio velox DSM 12556 TaxID=926567 RepID=H0URC1_9BACT|nr:peptidyl-tRNA hydrolase [Thermanaerovibrio velox DSM 12556]
MIVGLGNPGPQYVWTRHNAGWLVVDHLARAWGAGSPKDRFKSLFWDPACVEGEACCLMKPTTYMNLSGLAVAEAARYFKVPPEMIMVIYDDVALPFGRLRMRDRGSAGGQKGMASVIASLGTCEVPRLRIGVGSPEVPGMDLAKWVLSCLSEKEIGSWPFVARCAEDAIGLWIKLGVEKAMCRVNSKDFCHLG